MKSEEFDKFLETCADIADHYEQQHGIQEISRIMDTCREQLGTTALCVILGMGYIAGQEILFRMQNKG